ncbi:hypothetical protein LJC43_07950 [Parabacteroides sp. OttesenSCG-928-G21]|jgi:Na+-driven multidrug efflux pump|nr:hypothetical protein [Parabacteroides sp. OttesenSCG-928-G21]
MNRRKTFTRVLIGLAIIITIATVIAYFVIATEKPWLAFYVACCGGVIVVNLLISLLFVFKNFKNKD